jgi:glycosyltransferase involved in cell wall biosynthesis
MKILYDHQIFSSQKFGGISRYFFELMNHSEGLFDYEVSGIFNENEYIKSLGEYEKFPLRANFKGKWRIINIMNKANSIRKIKEGNYDVIHPTYYDTYIVKTKKLKPFVITVHDMIHELFPDYFVDSKRVVENKKNMIKNADKIIAISENTKKDILKFYPDVEPDKISVVYLGRPHGFTKEHEGKKNYILFTGQRGGYKNFDSFVCAVAPLLRRYDLQLVCTGQDFNKQEKALLQNMQIVDRTTCQFVDEASLFDVYSRALAFVFPSIYEGFGLPILEAFASGCPALLANTSSLPEIGGEAALYFDPYSITDMRAVIEKAVTSVSLREQLITKGREQVEKYSWQKCAEDTTEIYKNIVMSRYER